MSAVADDVVILLPQNNASVDRHIIFEGTGAPTAEIILTSDSNEIGRTFVAADRMWRIEYGKLGNGGTSIVATQIVQGTVSSHSINITVTTKPVGISWPVDGELTLSSFPVVGYCDKGAVLEFFIDGKSEQSMTPDSGFFEVVLGQIGDGEHRIGVQQRSINGEVASDVVEVTSNSKRQLAIRSPEQGESSSSVVGFLIEALPDAELTAIENDKIFNQGMISRFGTWAFPFYPDTYGEKTVTINQLLDGAVESRTVTFHIVREVQNVSIYFPENGAYISPQTSLHGGGDFGAKITLLEGNKAFAKGEVDSNEMWQIKPDKALTLGKKEITARQVAVDGSISRALINVEVVEKIPITINTPVNGMTVATNFVVAGNGTVNASVELTESNLLVGRTTVDSRNDWRVNVSGMTVGARKLAATQTYADGSISQATVHVEVIQIAPLIIVSPSQDSTITDLTPLIRGRGHPGINLFAVRAGIAELVACVDEKGDWAGRLPDNWFSYGENLLTIFQASEIDSSEASVRFFISQPPS
jgi:hypothetical protein